jgi:hypothetical protein
MPTIVTCAQFRRRVSPRYSGMRQVKKQRAYLPGVSRVWSTSVRESAAGVEPSGARPTSGALASKTWRNEIYFGSHHDCSRSATIPPRLSTRQLSASNGFWDLGQSHLNLSFIQEIVRHGDRSPETAPGHCRHEHPPARPARAKVGAWQVAALRAQGRILAVVRKPLPHLL